MFSRLNLSHADIPCVLENDVAETARSTQPVCPVTLYMTINITPPTLYGSPPRVPTKDNSSPAQEAPIPGHVQSPSPEHPSLLHHQSVEARNNARQSREEASPVSANDLRLALDQTDQAMERIDRSNTWQGAVRRIKWVMDTLSPVAEVRVIPF